MKRKTAALYDPYLDVMGGGERHILSILQVLEEEGYDITVFWDKDLSGEIKSRLNLRFDRLTFKPNIFRFPSPLAKLQALSGYDAFFYVTDGSYFFSSAKRNYVFCMVPDRKLYRMSLANRTKTFNYRFISNSAYTQKLLAQWGIDSRVIYPYIAQDLLDADIGKKEKMILAVGRFFPHLHAKKQESVIDAFSLFQKKHSDFKLVMAGGLKPEDEPYFKTLGKKAAPFKNVLLKPNIPYPQLLDLYHRSMLFWHFTGYGVDETKNPEQVEHLGMTPLEAMASGAIPFCYRAGGPKEIITEGKNGYLFRTFDELLSQTEVLLADQEKHAAMQKAARQTVEEKFSFNVFRETVKRTLRP